MRYIHDSENWWQFHYDRQQIMNVLGRVRAKQGSLIGRMMSLGFDSQDEAMLSNLSLELVRSSEIEGKELNLEEVRSSIARRLGIDTAGLVPVSRYVDGVVEKAKEYGIETRTPEELAKLKALWSEEDGKKYNANK